MKILTFFILLYTPLLSQTTFMNVLFSDVSYKNVDVDDITEISFNATGTEMTTTLSGGSNTDLLSTITEIAFDVNPKGNELPVELTNFYAQVSDNSITLFWQTATEVKNYGFQIERSVISNQLLEKEWVDIGFVEGHGNSNSLKEYSFIDVSPLNEAAEYRLKQIDTDGSFEYSKTITVELGIPTVYSLKQNYPNPFNPTTIIAYQIPKEGFVTLKVYDVLGREVSILVNENIHAGKFAIEFNSNRLSSGTYFYRLTSGEYTETIKMIVLK